MSNTPPEIPKRHEQPTPMAPSSRDSRGSYATRIIREVIVGPPFLIEGETIEISARHGYPVTILVISVIITFIPPFVWGPALFLIMYFQKKHDGVWITNKRLVNFMKVPFSRRYQVTSIPLGEIREITHMYKASLSSIIDRLFGVGDLQVSVKDAGWVRCHILDIKSPGKLIRHVRRVTNAEA